jgi:nucleotide-binding universal stress UspA family protein
MLPRFRHLLVPLDFTPKTRQALDVAFELAVENRARVTLLHVIETIDSAAEEDDEIREFYASLENRAWLELQESARRFEGTQVPVEQKVHRGKRAPEIVRYAAGHDVDLIVMSSHPVDLSQPGRGFATISYQVSVLCPCAVLLLKQDQTRRHP